MGDQYIGMVKWYKENSNACQIEHDGEHELNGTTKPKTRHFLPPDKPPEEAAKRGYQPPAKAKGPLPTPFADLVELLDAYIDDPPGRLGYIAALPEVANFGTGTLPELVMHAVDERRPEFLELLKQSGVENLADRQKFCNALARAMRENRIKEFQTLGASLVGEHWEEHCAQCGGAKSETRKLFYCTRCRAVKYCSAQCQKKAWTAHKVGCKKPE